MDQQARDHIILDPADYWQTRARINAVGVAERDQLRASLALAEVQRQQQAWMAEMIQKYQFVDGEQYVWDDASCVLRKKS